MFGYVYNGYQCMFILFAIKLAVKLISGLLFIGSLLCVNDKVTRQHKAGTLKFVSVRFALLF